MHIVTGPLRGPVHRQSACAARSAGRPVAGHESILFTLMFEDSPARHFAIDQVEIAEREYAVFVLLIGQG